MVRRYRRLTVELPPDGEERLVAEPPPGFLGLELLEDRAGTRRLLVWLEGGGPRPAPELWRRLGGRCLSERGIDEEDWMAAWRRQSTPLSVGERYWLDPREPSEVPAGDQPPAGRHWLRLPARRAFGVGSHETTRLALRLLEMQELTDRSLLDVGTGTGILALAALLEGARPVVALEVDPLAARLAAVNRVLNDLWPTLIVGRCDCLGPAVRFDLIVANIVPEHLVPELPAVRRLLAPAGRLVSSGILSSQADDFLWAAVGYGLAPRESRAAGEWVAFVLEAAR